MYDQNGVNGSGKWYGVPNYAEYTMVYYNKTLFDEHSVQVPKTLDELPAALETFQSKGLMPFANAGAEYMAQRYLYQLALSKADRDWSIATSGLHRQDRLQGRGVSSCRSS